MRELEISTAKNKESISWKPVRVSWAGFIERLRKVRRTAETAAEYSQMTDAERGSVKNGQAFIGGVVSGRRLKGNVQYRTAFTLDADHATEHFIDTVTFALEGTAYAIYSTHSYTPETPKYRLVVPASRDMSAKEHEAAARKLAEDIGMEYWDKTTFDVNRLMYLPSVSSDREPVLVIGEGESLDVDKLLERYGGSWEDPATWPGYTVEDRRGGTGKLSDPREKPGVIGAFCSAYTITDAIAELIPDAYEPTDNDNLWKYVGSTGTPGLKIYDYDTFAYSHHESDPISGMCVNAFDLVRIHLFRDLDAAVTDKTDINRLPSQGAMLRLAGCQPVVIQHMNAEAVTVFEVIPDDDEAGSADDGESDRASETDAERAERVKADIAAAREPRLVAAFGTAEPAEGENAKGVTAAVAALSSIRMPRGFKELHGRLVEIRETKNDIKYLPVCDTVVAVTKRITNITDNTQGLEVLWKVGEYHRTVTNTRSTFMDSKKIINLADYGFPVHSGNARPLSAYLSGFESENDDTLKTESVSNQLGWVKKRGFLLGDQYLGEEDIQFMPKDAGDGQIVDGLHTKGSKDRTFEVLEGIRDFTPVKMTVYAALAAPLLELIGESSFIFELAGGTSKGKTTAMRIAASLFGCPDEQKPGFFKQWNLTKVFIERYAATMNNLPLFIDDTKKADPRMVPTTVYQFCSGQGKGRGSLKGSQIGATWCTVLLSTGEQKLSSFSKDGGAVGRILSLHGSPFESTGLEIGSKIERMNELVSENYGHLVEPWIRFLMTLDKKEVKARVTAAGDEYKQLAASHGEVAMRLSRPMAILDVVGQMFDTCFGLDLCDRAALKRDWMKMLSGATEIDRASEALEDVMGWVAAHPNQFMRHTADDSAFFGNVLSGKVKEDEICIIGESLDTYLNSKGYEPTSLAKAWKDNGWLNTGEGRVKKSTRIGGSPTWAYCFNLKKLGTSFDLPQEA